MLHPIDVEEKLGFDQIRQRLTGYCLSSLGTGLVNTMMFSEQPDDVLARLAENHEVVQLFLRGDSLPASDYFDPREVFAKASIEGTWLEETDFLKVAFSIQTILTCRQYFVTHQENCPGMFLRAKAVHLSSALPHQIFLVVDDTGVVKDQASPELARVRKKLRDEQHRVRKLTEHVYRQAVEQQWVPEGALPTIRGGRLVIPVLAEYKRKLKGFIHDESATGQTVFMEPAEALEANNEIRDLEHEEKREVIRILTRLTDAVRNELPNLKPSYEFLAWVDFTRAKAKLSVDIGAVMPDVKSKPALRWMNARHPLLYLSLKGKRELVPLTIELNETDRMVLVSGPNAGGKSVCLKTVGLLQYMLQCGLLIPVSPDSTAGIFKNLFMDIGDQQSIENDLSTYSSHLRNMAHFIQHGNENTLVLLDELGSGTDPNFGGAIAQAVLHSLIHKNMWGVATTHYYNLKLFAEQQPGIRNAAMRFDKENLVPLYALEIGKPGSSFALEIAEQTGIPQTTLQEAKRLAGSDLVGLETLVRNLEREKNELAHRLTNLHQQEDQVKTVLQKYEALRDDLEARKKQIIDKAKEEARKLLADTNREIEKTIRHIRENQAQKNETLKVRKSLQAMKQHLHQQAPPFEPVVPGSIKTGDRVRIIGQEGSGVVLSVKGKSAMIQLGELKSKVDLTKLEKTTASFQAPTAAKSKSSGLSLNDKRAGYSSVLDVRGKRAEEVVPLLDQFLDTSVLLGQGEVKVLHGKGEGVLRKIIRDQLRKYKHVATFADEHIDRGGDGITVVVLK